VFDHVNYILIVVSDMDRSIHFYQDVLGLKMKLHSDMWSEFDTGRTTLALHGGGQGSGESTVGSRKSQAGSCSIGFEVADLDQTARDLQSQGIRFILPPTERKDEGIKLAICLDPDGLPVSLAETL